MAISKYKLSVAVPMFKAKHIAWLAMESLCRQKNIDFEWELIIAEEQNNNKFGKNKVMAYQGRLSEVGCTLIKYNPIDSWITLSSKWRNMAQQAEDSLAFVTLAADCHISPKRLSNNYRIFSEHSPSFVQTWYHNLYDLSTGTFYLYDNHHRLSAADMSLRMDVAKRLPVPPKNKKRGIDGWLYKRSRDIEGENFDVIYDESDAWNETIYVHGINYISKRNFKNKAYKKNKSEPKIPEDIITRLKTCRKFINKKGYI